MSNELKAAIWDAVVLPWIAILAIPLSFFGGYMPTVRDPRVNPYVRG